MKEGRVNSCHQTDFSEGYAKEKLHSPPKNNSTKVITGHVQGL